MNSCFQEVKMDSVFAHLRVSCLPHNPEGQLSRDCVSTHTDMQMSVRDGVKEKEAFSRTASKPSMGGWAGSKKDSYP